MCEIYFQNDQSEFCKPTISEKPVKREYKDLKRTIKLLEILINKIDPFIV